MDIYELGFDKNLSRGNPLPVSESLLSTMQTPISGGVSSSLIQSGAIDNINFSGKTSFTDTTNGYRMGLDQLDGTYKWILGGTGGSVDWNVTTANTLTITGAITATTGTIGGFTIGATTISATNLTLTSGAANAANITVGTGANAGGLNSANASGDITFWSGSTYANRATAPFRVTAAGAVTMTSATISGVVSTSIGTFGGNGADGALTVTSGTTTIDLAGAAVVVKNYTSISITGTGKVAFSNPHAGGTIVIFKSQGVVTLTSSTAPHLDLAGIGAVAGTGGAAASNGTDGTVANEILGANSSGGKLGNNTIGGAGGVVYTNTAFYLINANRLYRKAIYITAGSGGGGGAGGSNAPNGGVGGAGGRGGGGLYIECAGALNFTTAGGISVAGAVGTVGANSASRGGGGGGGGGAAGMAVILYNTLTAASGTVTVSGGNGGNGGTGDAAGTGAAGGGGGGMYNGAGGAGGGNQTDGANGSNSLTTGAGAGTGGTKGGAAAEHGGGGGGGTAGEYFIAQNTIFS
jgi:hypothetical protein